MEVIIGYEIVYSYYEKNETGEYNKELLKEKKVKIGSPHDDVSIDVLAGKILAQLARRNIFVQDVKIFEFIKKSISFRETDDGIVIKNKKFRFDDGPVIIGEEINTDGTDIEEIKPEVKSKPTIVQTSVKQVNQKPLRYETFDPESLLLEAAKSRGYKFTVGKKYPILNERLAAAGVMYTTQDDLGNKQILVDKFFVPIIGELAFESEMKSTKAEDISDRLNWSGVINDNVPNLRG